MAALETQIYRIGMRGAQDLEAARLGHRFVFDNADRHSANLLSLRLQSHCNEFQREFQFRGSLAYRPLRPVEWLGNCRNILRS
jgi:hypothetical protein